MTWRCIVISHPQMRKKQIVVKPKAITPSMKGKNKHFLVHSSRQVRAKKSMHATFFMDNTFNPRYGQKE